MSGNNPWSPVHHEDIEEETAPAKPKAAAKPKEAAGQGDPAIVLTFPPNMIAGIWSLIDVQEKATAAVEENTKAVRELLEAMRGGGHKSE